MLRKWVGPILFFAGACALLRVGSPAGGNVVQTEGVIRQPDTTCGDDFFGPDTVYGPPETMTVRYKCSLSSFLTGSFPDSLWTESWIVQEEKGFSVWVEGEYTPPITLLLIDCYRGCGVEIAKMNEWRNGRAGYALVDMTGGDDVLASGIYVLSLVAGDTTLAVPIYVNASVKEERAPFLVEIEAAPTPVV